MAQLLTISKGVLEFTPQSEQYKPKKFGALVVGIATKFLVNWAKPLLVSFIVALIKEGAKKESVESIVQDIINELDSDGDGKID